MEITIVSGDPGGSIRAINSKSQAHRLLICASLSEGIKFIECTTKSDDILATTECLKALGAGIEYTEEGFWIEPIDYTGCAAREKYPGVRDNWVTTNTAGLSPREAYLDARESGTTLRLLLPVVCALGVNAVIHMGGRLPKRPMEPLIDELKTHGCTIEKISASELETKGKLKGGDFSIPGNISSQFISGLLLALPLTDEGGTITVTGHLESKGYVDMTMDTLKSSGIKLSQQYSGDDSARDLKYIVPGRQKYVFPERFQVEGDWSNAAFWLAMGAISNKSVSVSGLKLTSRQKDKEIVQLLKRFGAAVSYAGDTISVEKAPVPMHGIVIDAGQIPDLVPVLSVLAAASTGRTTVKNAARLRIKESDRLKTTAALISGLGGDIEETSDCLIIEGSGKLKGGTVDSFNDHRIAMAAAVASVICDHEVTIKDAQAVNKSYPSFWQDFKLMGGHTK